MAPRSPACSYRPISNASFLQTDSQFPLSHQELTGLRKTGEIFFLLLSVSEGNVSNTRFFTVMARDNSERHIFESELEYLATHDTLTGLPNRTLLYDRLQQAITQCARAKKLAAILFIDLDRFKIINDTLGHAAGDIVLKEVADTFARLPARGRLGRTQRG